MIRRRAGAALSFYMIVDVSRAIASIVKPMQALGVGDLSAEVPHLGERTEIGAVADTLQVFKEALIAKSESDHAAKQEAEVKIERSRRVDAITHDFESLIGEIVETVASTSSQLEASAGKLGVRHKRERRRRLRFACSQVTGRPMFWDPGAH